MTVVMRVEKRVEKKAQHSAELMVVMLVGPSETMKADLKVALMVAKRENSKVGHWVVRRAAKMVARKVFP